MSEKSPNHPAFASDASQQGAAHWVEKEVPHGIRIVELNSWRHFGEFLHRTFSDTRPYIWRGQRDAAWTLQTTFDRLLTKKGKHGLVNDERLARHLSQFKDAILGRRGPNPRDLGEDELWALGQHYGLATPLLDWTRSPFVAAYFAFCGPIEPSSKRRAIFALHQGLILQTDPDATASVNSATTIKIFKPSSDENARLINQAGLFTRTPVNYCVEDCIRKTIKASSTAKILWKITLPDDERDMVLTSLNRMNINHATLFPDLYGAAKFANAHSEIHGYGTYLP